MSEPEAVSAGRRTASSRQSPVRVAFVGSRQWLDSAAPAADVCGMRVRRFSLSGGPVAQPADADLRSFRPHATVIFDPTACLDAVDVASAGTTLGVVINGAGAGTDDGESYLGELDRLVSFDPALTGERIGGQVIWRAMPPPVSDVYYADVQAPHRTPRAMTLGASNEHREAMLMPAKHHHDVLQLIHGAHGAELAEMLHEYDVGIFVSEREGGGFGHEAGVHLAAGQLLLAAAGPPAYGLERNIDYLHAGSADELVWLLARMGRFPEMHHRVRVRGRVKAEQFRSSRVFARVVHDLLLDHATFGDDAGAPRA